MTRITDEIKRLNRTKKIKIRTNKLPDGYSLYLEFNKNYRRERQFLNLKVSESKKISKSDEKTLYQAEIIRDMKELELFGEKHNFVFQNKLSDADFVEYFSQVSKSNNLPSYNGSLRHFQKFLRIENKSSYINFSSVNSKLCGRFREYLLNKVSTRELANQTAKTYMTVFAATLNRAVKDGIIQSNPASRIRIKDIESKREFLTEYELKQFILCETKYDDIKNAFIFSSQTSLRLGDIRALEFQDIRFNKENEAFLYFRQQKTKGVSNIKLSKLAIEIFKKQKAKYKKETFVFHLPSSRTFINDKLREIAKAAGIKKKIHYHVSRHTWATLAISRGVDIYTVSKIMHHSSVAITEIYSNLIDKKKFEVADLINIDIREEDNVKQKYIDKSISND